MLHLITAAKIQDHARADFGVILAALGRKKRLSLASWPFGYAKLEEGYWKIRIGNKGRQVFFAKVQDFESDLARAIRYLPPAVILVSQSAAERLLPILEKYRVMVEVHHTDAEL